MYVSRVVGADVVLADLRPLAERTDAIQSFVSQETVIVTVWDEDGASGTGYSYTIGAGGSSIVALLQDHLLPRLIGREAESIEAIWHDLMFGVHALGVGPVLSLSLAAVDTALWDLRSHRTGIPITRLVGGAHDSLPVYTTEGGWLHLTVEELVADALRMRESGFAGAKIKVGKPRGAEDLERLTAVREAVGPQFELMADANQALTLDQAMRRSHLFEPLDLGWLEEPMPADDLGGHARLARSTSVPIAVGESLYSIGQFKDYLQAGACSIVQVDVARVGGITPWLKVAHLAEAYNVAIAPHFLMELHIPLACGVRNGAWVEHIPQLGPITSAAPDIRAGRAYPPSVPGLGIDWNWAAIEQHSLTDVVTIGAVADPRRNRVSVP